MVAVPEMPADPSGFAATLAAGGYFEAVCVTREDHDRSGMYQANAKRESLRSTATDLAGYLVSLRMVLTAAPIDELSLARVTQLINKTNQFNLTTLRLAEAEVRTILHDPSYLTLQFSLKDRFGDNGIIAVLIARVEGAEAAIEEFLMSCRVLGRRVEEACMNALVETCEARGIRRLRGIYRPTPKNAIVRDLFPSLGFEPIASDKQRETIWSLAIPTYTPRSVPIEADITREALV